MAPRKSNQVTFTLSDEEVKLARRLVRRERRYKAPSVNLWARAVVQQYLHEFKVMPGAWNWPSITPE